MIAKSAIHTELQVLTELIVLNFQLPLFISRLDHFANVR